MEQSAFRLEYKVGIFIVVGLVGVMASVLMLSGDRSVFTSYMHVKAHFAEVQGLFPGSVVSLAGVPIGNVEKIEFVAGANKLELEMKINREFAARVVEGTIAEVKTQGALGDKFVYLKPGPPGGKSLPDGALLVSDETDFMKMLTSREDGAARVIDLIKELHILVGTINQNGQAGMMMKNFTESSVKLNSTLGKIDLLLGEMRGEIPENHKLKAALISLASILDKIDQGKGSLGQLINDPGLHQSLKAYLGTSQRGRYMKDMIGETLKHSE